MPRKLGSKSRAPMMEYKGQPTKLAKKITAKEQEERDKRGHREGSLGHGPDIMI